jgi:vacuolar-type H+-ATPase subunit H
MLVPAIWVDHISGAIMSKDNHVVEAHHAAAKAHEDTAKSHKTAAEECSKGHHEHCEHQAKAALENSAKAHAASTLAHDKSEKPVAVGAK